MLNDFKKLKSAKSSAKEEASFNNDPWQNDPKKVTPSQALFKFGCPGKTTFEIN